MVDLRDRRFAHADRADLVRFHQGDIHHFAEAFNNGVGSEPTGGATASDDKTSFVHTKYSNLA